VAHQREDEIKQYKSEASSLAHIGEELTNETTEEGQEHLRMLETIGEKFK